tara:strand:+ start:9137 stop:10063 length:927 start_codon:yes stop_codon:yes gene_type:complete
MITFKAYFENILNEAKVVTPNRGDTPINFGDTIRVYHGFRDTRDALDAAKVGMSGKQRASRVYSYESNNNPKGLFVSSSIKDTKEFTGAYEEISVIAEIHAPESELEIPVWPGGSYTGQGGMSEYWSNDSEENNNQRKDAQAKKIQWILDQAKKQRLDWVLESDRPDLAWFLQMGGENQALFTGDLNPNSIRAFWVRGKGESGYQSINDSFSRISRKEFINKIKSNYTPKSLKRDYYDKTGRKKIFMPREKFNVEKLLDGIGREDRDFALDTVQRLARGGNDPEEMLNSYLWPYQMGDAKIWWNSLKD